MPRAKEKQNPIEAELDAMVLVRDAIEELEAPSRRRVLSWLTDVFGLHAPAVIVRPEPVSINIAPPASSAPAPIEDAEGLTEAQTEALMALKALGGAANVAKVAAHLGVHQTTVSYHLRSLLKKDRVRNPKRGVYVVKEAA